MVCMIFGPHSLLLNHIHNIYTFLIDIASMNFCCRMPAGVKTNHSMLYRPVGIVTLVVIVMASESIKCKCKEHSILCHKNKSTVIILQWRRFLFSDLANVSKVARFYITSLNYTPMTLNIQITIIITNTTDSYYTKFNAHQSCLMCDISFMYS